MQSNGSAISLSQASSLIYYEGGISSFYRGIGSPLLALTLLNTLNFSSYGYFRTKFGVSDIKLKNREFEYLVGIAAACAGPIASLISTPFEFIKIQMQLDVKNSYPSSPKFKSSLHCANTIGKEYGYTTLYTAHGVNTLREILFLSTYFMMYEHIKQFISNSVNSSSKSFINTIAIPIAGGLSGSIGWFISFPLDCVKANIQGNSNFKSNIKDKKPAFKVSLELIKTKGIMGLYSGLAPSIIRAFIVSSSRFSAYEFVLSILGKDEEI
jgi:hypothetical protein